MNLTSTEKIQISQENNIFDSSIIRQEIVPINFVFDSLKNYSIILHQIRATLFQIPLRKFFSDVLQNKKSQMTRLRCYCSQKAFFKI